MLSKDQAVILRLFRGLHAEVGQMVPVATLFLNWPPSRSNHDFADAVEALAADGLLRPGMSGTEYALTETGAGAFAV